MLCLRQIKGMTSDPSLLVSAVVSALNKAWCVSCFSCSTCNTKLTLKYVPAPVCSGFTVCV